MTCASCGASLASGARFCDQCGTPVSAPLEHELRKTVTLLFTDVTGSTALGEELDPEAYRGVMGRYFEVARAAVEKHGGTVEKFVGDAVLAVFGIPEVREDDALRAVRAAAEVNGGISALAEDLERELGVRLEVRTGVNTGSVVAGTARAGGSFATGDAVNTAARLEQAAAPGSVLIGEQTYRLVRDAVLVEPVDPVLAKGKAEPVAAYRLLSVHDVDHGRRRRQDRSLIGRDREARLLVDALDRTLETRRSHLVTVVGGPGIGKSRLVADFVDQVGDRASVLTGRCVSYGQGITFFPVVQLLRQAAGLAGSESDEVSRKGLLGAMGEAEDAEEVVARLLPLLGKGGEPGSAEETFWAVRRLLEQVASRQPVVVTVDDLHWAEPTLIELIERIREELRDLPLLWVCQTRPELLDARPTWGGGSLNSTIFGLEPFSEQQTAASLTALLGGQVGPEVGATVTEWAGGNPLFVEEVADHLIERGLLEQTPAGWRLTGDLASADVPPTVAALLAARLDRLPEGERRLVERLSVAGLELTVDDATFLAEGLLDPGQVAEALAALAHRDLLQRRRGPGPEVWTFRHLLVREAAYESLPKALRADLHERFAVRIEGQGDEAGSERYAFAAHHLEQAFRFRQELAPLDPGLTALAGRTADVLSRAAGAARDREDLAAAAGLLRRALALELPPQRRRELLIDLIQVFADEERVDDIAVAAEELAAATDELADELDRLAVRVIRGLADLSRSEPVAPDELAPLARGCADLAQESGRSRLRVLALMTLATCSMMRARWEEVGTVFEEMNSIGRAQDRRWANLFRGAAIVYGRRPIADLGDQIERIVAQGGHSPTEEDQLSLVRLLMSAASDEPNVAEAIAAEEARPSPLPAIFRLMYLSLCAIFAGLDGRAVHLLRALADVMLEAGDLSHASTILPWLALTMSESDDPDVEEMERLVEQGAEVTSPYDVLSLALVAGGRGMVASLRGQHERARGLTEEAIRICDASDQITQQADFRYWGARIAGRRGDAVEQRRLLGEALERYRSKGLVVWVRRCEELLAALV
jgi:class 3 adenylate cyclase